MPNCNVTCPWVYIHQSFTPRILHRLSGWTSKPQSFTLFPRESVGVVTHTFLKSQLLLTWDAIPSPCAKLPPWCLPPRKPCEDTPHVSAAGGILNFEVQDACAASKSFQGHHAWRLQTDTTFLGVLTALESFWAPEEGLCAPYCITWASKEYYLYPAIPHIPQLTESVKKKIIWAQWFSIP